MRARRRFLYMSDELRYNRWLLMTEKLVGVAGSLIECG